MLQNLWQLLEETLRLMCLALGEAFSDDEESQHNLSFLTKDNLRVQARFISPTHFHLFLAEEKT